MKQSALARHSQAAIHALMALALGVMALAVFINVVLRYGFGSGVAASEELSRLLFVWMVFLGATVAYPAGEHMAFTSLAGALQSRPKIFSALTVLIRLLVMAARLVTSGIPLATACRAAIVDPQTDDADTAAALAEVVAAVIGT